LIIIISRSALEAAGGDFHGFGAGEVNEEFVLAHMVGDFLAEP
jgi:hypothetical protein